MGGRVERLYVVVAVLFIGGYQLLPDDVWLRIAWQCAVGYGAAAAIVLGVRRLPRRARLPWWCFAGGIVANTSGIPVADFYYEILGWQSLASPSDPLFLALYPACSAGLWLMIRRRDTRRNWAALVDAAVITTGLGLLSWIYVIEPAAGSDETSIIGGAVQAAYPIGDLVLLALTVRLLRAGGGRDTAQWWIAGSLCAFLVGDAGWVVMNALGGAFDEVQWVSRSLDMVYLVAFAVFGLAAQHAGARTANRGSTPASQRLSPFMLVTLAAAALIAPAVLAVQVHAGSVDNGLAIALGCTALFLLVVTRMALLLRQVEEQERQVRELSLHDELTGLPNRRAWNDELPRALDIARRDGVGVSVGLLDLDQFKLYNDSYGHPAGDRLLKEAAAAWHGALRRVDILARYGGEEFIVLLPAADTDEATTVLGRAAQVTPSGQTFSAGVATWDGTESADELVIRADRALYAAKNAGRNRVLGADHLVS